MRFLDKLLTTLMENKFIYSTTAEIIGVSFKQNSPLSSIDQLVRDKINSLFSNEDHLRALLILQGISKHSPTFVDAFFLKIFSQFKRFTSEVQAIALQLFKLRIESIETPFTHMQPYWKSILHHRHYETQTAALELLEKLLPQLDISQVALFIKSIKYFRLIHYLTSYKMPLLITRRSIVAKSITE